MTISTPMLDKARSDGLHVDIIHGRLVISIGVSALCFAATRGPYFDDICASTGKDISVTDEDAFAAAILRELRREEEDGTTLVHLMLDKAAERAVESGAEGIEIPPALIEGADAVTRHTIRATYEREDADTGSVIECVEVRIHYTYKPGERPSYSPRAVSPPDPPEIEFVAAEMEVEAHKWEPAPDSLAEWAENWLYEYVDDAIERAEHDRQHDPDAAYDTMRDSRFDGRQA